MFLEQRQKFLLECHLLMMNRLVFAVLNNFVQLRHADTAGAVFHLPAKQAVLGECFMHPFGGATLDQLQCLGNRKSRGKRQQDMDVVWHAAPFEGLHLVLPRDAAQEGPEPVAELGGDQRPALLGAENAMVMGTDVGHARIQPSLRDSGGVEISVPTLKRWAILRLVPSGQRHSEAAKCVEFLPWLHSPTSVMLTRH